MNESLLSGAKAGDNLSIEVVQAGVEERKDGDDEIVQVCEGGAGGAAMEAEGLDGDLGDAVKFYLCGFEVLLGGGLEGGGSDEVEEVGDCLERVIDLVRDGGGETPGDGEFFGAAEDLFALLLEREVGDEGGQLALLRGHVRIEECHADEDFNGLSGAGEAGCLKWLRGDGGEREEMLNIAKRRADSAECVGSRVGRRKLEECVSC